MTAVSLPSAVECCRSVSYPALGNAATVAERINRMTGDRRHPYITYRCGHCDRWHLRRRPPFDLNDPDDRRRAELAAAGWRQINNPDVERWVADDVTHRNRSAGKKTLNDAWRKHLRTEGAT